MKLTQSTLQRLPVLHVEQLKTKDLYSYINIYNKHGKHITLPSVGYCIDG